MGRHPPRRPSPQRRRIRHRLGSQSALNCCLGGGVSHAAHQLSNSGRGRQISGVASVAPGGTGRRCPPFDCQGSAPRSCGGPLSMAAAIGASLSSVLIEGRTVFDLVSLLDHVHPVQRGEIVGGACSVGSGGPCGLRIWANALRRSVRKSSSESGSQGRSLITENLASSKLIIGRGSDRLSGPEGHELPLGASSRWQVSGRGSRSHCRAAVPE